MKSVEVCKNLLKPLTSEDGQEKLEVIKKVFPPMYKDMMKLKNQFNILLNDLLKYQGFINILEADKTLYEKRIEYKKQKHLDYSKDKAILDRINEELSLLKVKEDI